jgi:hypothetical protein
MKERRAQTRTLASPKKDYGWLILRKLPSVNCQTTTKFSTTEKNLELVRRFAIEVGETKPDKLHYGTSGFEAIPDVR